MVLQPNRIGRVLPGVTRYGRRGWLTPSLFVDVLHRCHIGLLKILDPRLRPRLALRASIGLRGIRANLLLILLRLLRGCRIKLPEARRVTGGRL